MLGTGMHTGILFLFPFIGEVCLLAQTCNSLNFDTYGKNSFYCFETLSKDNSTVTFFGLYSKICLPCILWGSGTAIGEVPPYLITYAAKKAGKHDEFEDIQNEINSSPNNMLTKMKLWMIKFLEKYGFWAVLAFASWPNAAFDMCGIACGHFEMDFWTFFGGTWLGKGIIKINLQMIFFITLFNERLINIIINTFENIGFINIGDIIRDFVNIQKNKFLNPNKNDNNNNKVSIIKYLWICVIVGFVLLFLGSMIESLAQQKQREMDDKKIEKIKNNN